MSCVDGACTLSAPSPAIERIIWWVVSSSPNSSRAERRSSREIALNPGWKTFEARLKNRSNRLNNNTFGDKTFPIIPILKIRLSWNIRNILDRVVTIDPTCSATRTSIPKRSLTGTRVKERIKLDNLEKIPKLIFKKPSLKYWSRVKLKFLEIYKAENEAFLSRN